MPVHGPGTNQVCVWLHLRHYPVVLLLCLGLGVSCLTLSLVPSLVSLIIIEFLSQTSSDFFLQHLIAGSF